MRSYSTGKTGQLYLWRSHLQSHSREKPPTFWIQLKAFWDCLETLSARVDVTNTFHFWPDSWTASLDAEQLSRTLGMWQWGGLAQLPAQRPTEPPCGVSPQCSWCSSLCTGTGCSWSPAPHVPTEIDATAGRETLAFLGTPELYSPGF